MTTKRGFVDTMLDECQPLNRVNNREGKFELMLAGYS
jgi:hypothetical protein